MAGLKVSMVVFMVMMVASMQFQSSMAQTRHIVGGPIGWTIPNGGAATYTTWASQQNFTVGDSLVFNFTTGAHNAAEVSQAAYGPCTATNPLSIATTGPATVPLTTAGTHYYFCTVGAHCQAGQKLTINVSAAAAAPTPVPVPAPVSPPTAAPTPPPTSSPAPSPPEASPPSPPASTPSPTGSTPPSPTGDISPSPTGDTTPSPAGSTTPPPPGSAAASFAAVAPVTFLAVALAFFY